MEEEDSNKIVEDFFLKINYIRNTVDGILVSGNPNVWNVFGGLSRTEKAVFDAITNNLRNEDANQMQKDVVKELCKLLMEQYQCDHLHNDGEDADSMLMFWIEHRLLSHSLYPCLLEVFKNRKDENIIALYKEFSFMKNEYLVDGFLNCLSALQQNSMDQLAAINSLFMDKSKFFDEILPWVKEKIRVEYKINQEITYSPPVSPSFQIGEVDSKCEYCNLLLDGNSHESICTCSNEMLNNSYKEKKTIKTLKRQGSSFSQDVLMKSALSAVLERPEENTWYDNNDIDSDTVNDLRHRLTRMKDLSRSESCLFQTHEYLDRKEVLSDHDLARSHELAEEQVKKHSPDADSLDNYELPRSSSRVYTKRKGHSRSKSDQIGMITALDYTDGKEEASLKVSSSLPKENVFPDSSGCYYYRSEDGQLIPKPYEGQSLISYLDSRSYDTGAQLDKENAHFSICEALITAIEQMRCQKEDSMSDCSDDEIKFLKKKISNRKRIMRRQSTNDLKRGDIAYSSGKRIIRRQSANDVNKDDIAAFSDPASDTGRSSTSFKTSSTFSSSMSSSNPDEKIADVTPQFDDRAMLNISASWENVSLAKSKSPEMARINSTIEKIEIIKEEEIPPDDYSAEAVAKNLLKKFHGRTIPAASELKWMVTEEDVPQQLLPLPTAWPVAPDTHLDDNEYGLSAALRKVSMPSLMLRGNLEWAPPRPQIIFSPHAFVKRKIQLQRQHFRCAGCGLKVTPSLSKRFRYCEYLGKYFCTSCHQNKLAVIPSKILSKWDFKKYPVSDFAKDLLKKIYRDPLFNISDVAPSLYQNVRALSLIRSLRLQLHHVKKFLITCRHAESYQNELDKLSMHLCDDPHAYSLDDLIQVKNGELQILLKNILNDGISHIKEKCLLCSSKGFVCEICQDGNDILYPFDLKRVSICHECKTCYHRNCFVEGKCGRCERISARKKLLEEPAEKEDS